MRPVRLHLSAGGRDQAAAYEIGLELSQVETNVALGPEAFELQVPPEARPMTLDELRRASPLTAPGGSHD